ncbi:hypothetical protein FB45DRAFT_1029467 [Roridomyces roridus]|uniref:Uncharacterized protein n=1 Tax=Roridomyces roridus TaxID=1738132 RepID=A0AAD7FJ27_9AGAR|nr:hypothetical protein FB45DRAFT_1029467 [Roridomyces roridus]
MPPAPASRGPTSSSAPETTPDADADSSSDTTVMVADTDILGRLRILLQPYLDAEDAGTRRPSKRARRGALSNKSTPEKLFTLSKFFSRAVSCFDDIGDSVGCGVSARLTPTRPGANGSKKVQAKRTRLLKNFELFLTQAPEIIDILQTVFKKKGDWQLLLILLRKGATAAQHHDTNGIRGKPSYALQPGEIFVPSLDDGSASKPKRGMNNQTIRSFLAPWPLRIRLEEDEEVDGKLVLTVKAVKLARKLKSSTLKITDDDWPSVFYMPDGFDKNDLDNAARSSALFLSFYHRIEGCWYAYQISILRCLHACADTSRINGLFRSLFIVRILRHIWVSPTLGKDGADRLPPTCNARAHAQFTVPGRMVAYACVLGRTALTTYIWERKAGGCNYVRMFNEVVDFFERPGDDEDDEDPWIAETLKWLTVRVFPDGAADDDDDNSDSGDDDQRTTSKIMAQRKARLATRKAAQNAGAQQPTPPSSSSAQPGPDAIFLLHALYVLSTLYQALSMNGINSPVNCRGFPSTATSSSQQPLKFPSPHGQVFRTILRTFADLYLVIVCTLTSLIAIE